MSDDSYKIIISISHHRISYEYWQRDGENKLVPMPGGNWPAPLAFYCSDADIIIGEDAKRAANSGTDNAFDNYFDKLLEDSSYTIGGQKRPIRNLLLDASEAIFRDFFRQILLNRYGYLSDNRANMPLTLVCESDIRPNERALLQGLFKDSGYNRVRVVDYDRYINRYINEYLSHDYICDKVIVAWSEGSDLTFSIFGVNNDMAPIVKTVPNLGIDPRMKYAEEMIWERLLGQNPWLQKESEADTMSKAASDFLSSSLPLVNDEIILSDGIAYRYSLSRNAIDYVQNSEGGSIKEALELFLSENGITNRSRVLLLLRGLVAGNSYFVQNLSSGFAKTIISDKKLRDNTMRFIISEVIPENEPTIPPPPQPQPDKIIKEISKKWRLIRAEAKGKQRSGHTGIALQMLKDFESECEKDSGAENILAEVKNEIMKLREVASNSEKVQLLKREWREIKAVAKGKSRSGNNAEARSILKKFLDKVIHEIGTGELAEIVAIELSYIPEDSGATLDKRHKIAVAKNNDRQSNKSNTDAHDMQKGNDAFLDSGSDGKSLIAQGKLKEARDWYRSKNYRDMAQTLSDIIRAKKGVEVRKASIEEYKKSKNKEQIKRIINEIQAYIELCKKAGIDSTDYKKLLLEYRKI